MRRSFKHVVSAAGVLHDKGLHTLPNLTRMLACCEKNQESYDALQGVISECESESECECGKEYSENTAVYIPGLHTDRFFDDLSQQNLTSVEQLDLQADMIVEGGVFV